VYLRSKEGSLKTRIENSNHRVPQNNRWKLKRHFSAGKVEKCPPELRDEQPGHPTLTCQFTCSWTLVRVAPSALRELVRHLLQRRCFFRVQRAIRNGLVDLFKHIIPCREGEVLRAHVLHHFGTLRA